MKKILSVLIVIVMIAAFIPVIPVSAATMEGPFIPMKLPGVSDDSQWPLAGYEYTSEGFVSISPDYTNYTVRQCIVTRDSYRLDKNNDDNGHVLSLEFTVDSFPYKGETGAADEWIAICVWDEQQVNQESDGTGHGFHTLIRGDGEGTESCLNCVVNGAGCNIFSTTTINPELDDDQHEKYTFVVDRDSNGDYTIEVCGVDVGYCETLTDAFNNFTDHAYVSITLHSTSSDEGAAGSIKITKFNGEVPYGDDSAAPEENKRNFAPIADKDTVPENTPALLWDASLRDTSSLSGTGSFVTNDDGTITCYPTSVTPWIFWNVKAESSYEANDFPYVAYLTKGLDVSLTYFYCAGDVLAPGNDCAASGEYDTYDLYDDWELGVTDLGGLWEGRINALRADSTMRDFTDENDNYEPYQIGFLAFFRSEEEALVYANAFIDKLYAGVDTSPAVTTAAETTAEEKQTEEDTTVASGNDTAASDPAGTGDVTGASTGAAETTGNKENSGCGSVIGAASLIFVIALAGVSCKRKK